MSYLHDSASTDGKHLSYVDLKNSISMIALIYILHNDVIAWKLIVLEHSFNGYNALTLHHRILIVTSLLNENVIDIISIRADI